LQIYADLAVLIFTPIPVLLPLRPLKTNCTVKIDLLVQKLSA